MDNNSNARAVSVANSWLTAVGIPHTISKVDGYDIHIVKSTGDVLEIAINDGDNIPEIWTLYQFVVSAEALSSPNKVTALKAFHEITETAGYGKPIPVDRGPDPEHKLNLDDEFELVAMRHREFRLAPNPSEATLKRYLPIVNNVVRHYFNSPKNRSLFLACGYTEDDLKTFALIWTTNYIHKYTIANDDNYDNEKLLTTHLKQRFNEFLPLLWKKASIWFPAADAVTSGLYPDVPSKRLYTEDWGNAEERKTIQVEEETETSEPIAIDTYQPPAAKAPLLPQPSFKGAKLGGAYGKIYFNDPRVEQEDDLKYIKRNNKLDTSSASSRKKSASALLAQSLLALPHNTRLTKLVNAAENRSFSIDVRKEAGKQIRLHRSSCKESRCMTAHSLSQKVKDVSGSDTSGIEE